MEGAKNVEVRLVNLRSDIEESISVAGKFFHVDKSELSGNVDRQKPRKKSEDQPIITMESVRIALRRLEFGNKALYRRR